MTTAVHFYHIVSFLRRRTLLFRIFLLLSRCFLLCDLVFVQGNTIKKQLHGAQGGVKALLSAGV
jgi:hypothetical protein